MGELQSRKYQLTINNPIEKEWTHEKIKQVISEMQQVLYWCMADEIGLQDGTYHTHVYIAFASARKVSTIQNKFPFVHFEVCKGTSQQNRDYVAKSGKWSNDVKQDTCVDGTFEEFGEIPIERQGQRNDLTDLYDMIASGQTDYEIVSTNPNYMLHLEKIQQVRRVIYGEKYRNTWRQINVEYIYGETGTGKSRTVLETHGYDNVYRITDYKHPWDSYSCQPVIVFEEFRSSLTCADMLNYLDGYPVELPSRYSNKIACFTKIYIISNIPIEEQYITVQRDSPETYKAFIRRIHKIYEFTKEKQYAIDYLK